MIYKIILSLLYLPIFINQYKIFQYNHYEINKYFLYKSRKKIIIQAFNLMIFIMAIVIENYFIAWVIMYFMNLACLKEKGKIKITNRIKRFACISLIVEIVLLSLFRNLIIGLMILNTFILIEIIMCHLISVMIENMIMARYLKEAKNIVNGKKIIGITGSFGKTSCKNILYDLMSDMCCVSKTPKSYNTKVGIIKSIREEVNGIDEYFICEYGVDKKGGMDKLLKVLKPNVVLISEIGNQHILTFKNINNIIDEKMKLAKSLKKEETAVLNNDNKYLFTEKEKLKCKVITYGIYNRSDIMAKNIKISKEGAFFDLLVFDKCIKNVHICLLGEHNIMNFLGAVGVLVSNDIDISKIKDLARNIKSIEHRLELKNINNIRVIDDSFNANEKGFKTAIDILKEMETKRIVITPGIIEQGSNNSKINYELGMYMSDKVDVVILVEKNSSFIKKGLEDSGFNVNKIIEKKNFKEAWECVKGMDEEKIVLIENDLPSIYLK